MQPGGQCEGQAQRFELVGNHKLLLGCDQGRPLPQHFEQSTVPVDKVMFEGCPTMQGVREEQDAGARISWISPATSLLVASQRGGDIK